MSGGYFSSDTIAAIATSLAGDGGVGIIRVSGPNSLLASQKTTTGLENPEPRYLHRIEVRDATHVIDDGLAVYFPEGKSFTGEDVVELQLHGGRFLLQTVLKFLLQTGLVRMALPGEFSFRAVRNGKMTLTEAQAVKQLIGAKSFFDVNTARKVLSKSRVGEFDEIASKLKNLLAQCELSIDFMDQDVEVIAQNKLMSELLEIGNRLDDLTTQLKNAQRIAAGIKITIIGRPNAGKSTLFNALLAEDRAIVSSLAGTTRDIITEEISLGQYYIRLADTAGIRKNITNGIDGAIGVIEQEGIGKALDLISNSDLILLLLDATENTTGNATDVDLSNKKILPVLNKVDIARNLDEKSGNIKKITGKAPLMISALQGEGIDTLLTAIKDRLDDTIDVGAVEFLPTEFQLQMLVQCRDSVERALGLTGRPELLSANLSSALRSISDLAGVTTPDTILEKIFGEFCIGK